VERVRGYEKLMEAFGRVVRRGRLAHAYLFVGPPGVGKRLFAHELAQALLCEVEGDTFAPCGQCPACLLVAAESHPDFFTAGVLEGKHEFAMETMQNVCKNFTLKSARGRGKVAVLDDADDFNEESANCFLKTLEEPPPRSVLILIGTALERLMPTIVSRCQVIRFAELPDEVVKDVLRSQGQTDEALITRLARLSCGSPGQAALLADPALWEFRNLFLKGIIQPRPDTPALAKAFTQLAEEAGKETAPQRQRFAVFLRVLIVFLRDALEASVGNLTALMDAEDARLVQALTRRLNTDGLLRLLERCLEAERHMDRYTQVALTIEGLVDALGQEIAVA